MACQMCIGYQNQLKLKEEELKELNANFADCKLKTNAHLAELQSSFENLAAGSDNAVEDRAILYARLLAAENEIERHKEEAEALQIKLAAKETELRDHAIKIRNLEEQLNMALDKHVASAERHPVDVEVVARRDLERMHSQLLYKDTRIMELNNTILDKERQILDLQEMCREQSQVVQARSKAFQIVQQRVMELDSKTSKDVSTETDSYFPTKLQLQSSPAVHLLRKEMNRRQQDSSTPGRAVMLMKSDRHSPPPVDPSEDQSSVTTETLMVIEDGESTSRSPQDLRRKQRKKVTFDLKPQRTINAEGLAGGVCDDIAQAVIDLTSENDELRKIIRELENDTLATAQSRITQLEEEVERVRREGKNQALKARAAAQGRIRELEETIAGEQGKHKEEAGRLMSTVEALRVAREWSIEENARLLEQIAASQKNCDEFKEKLKESEDEKEALHENAEKDQEMIVRLAENVEETQHTVNALVEQKASILEDVERLKEAIEAQDEYISALEDDIVIYEEHIGLLRDSLGASKVENRAFIKSKAFETKLKALEQEKEQMTKRNNDERLRIKALSAKIRSLENENAELVERLRKRDSESAKSVTEVIEGSSVLAPSDGGFIACKRDTMTSSSVVKHFQGDRLSSAASLPNISCEEVGVATTVPNDVSHLHVKIRELHAERERLKQQCVDSGKREIDLKRQICKLEDDLLQQNNSSGWEGDKKAEDLREKLALLQEEYDSAQERVQHMECANFELEVKLKEAIKDVQTAEEKIKLAEEKLDTAVAEFGARETKYTAEIALLLKKDAENSEFIAQNESLVGSLQEEIVNLHCELEYRKMAMEQACRVEKELQTLKEQVRNNSERLMRQWSEKLTERGELADSERSADAGLSAENEAWKDEKRMLESELIALKEDHGIELETLRVDNIRKLEALQEENNKELEALRLQMNSEVSSIEAAKKAELERALAEKDSILQRTVERMESEISALKTKANSCELNLLEYHELENDFRVLQAELESLQKERDDLNLVRNEEKEKALVLEKEKVGLEQQLNDYETKNSKLVDDYAALNKELDSERTDLHELQLQFDRLLSENKEQAGRLMELEELRHTAMRVGELEREYCSLNEERTRLASDVVQLNEKLQLFTAQQCEQMQRLSEQSSQTQWNDAFDPKIEERIPEFHLNTVSGVPVGSVTVAGPSERRPGPENRVRLGRTDVSVENVVGMNRMERLQPDVLCGSNGPVNRDQSNLEMENIILRECVAQNTVMQDTLSEDVHRLMEIKTELETTVEALKGEIWSLNGQLKSAIADRDEFSDKLCDLTQLMESEREDARQRERELEEQKDVAEKSQRQAALAENESNRRLVEWQEKSSEMENNYIQLQTAYNQLTAYYQQLQEAYNALYGRFAVEKAETATETLNIPETFSSQKDGYEEISKVMQDLNLARDELQRKNMELRCGRETTLMNLASLRNVLSSLRNEELVELKADVNKALKTMSTEIRNNLDSVFSETERLRRQNSFPDAGTLDSLKQLLKEVLGAGAEESLCNPESVYATVESAKKELRLKEKQALELREALEEKRTACNVLESRLEEYEQKMVDSATGQSNNSAYIAELEEMLESAQLSLKEQVGKAEELQLKVAQLESTRMDMDEATKPARLSTKVADNDALFRCNEELAQTNLKLQNEIDSLREQLNQLSSKTEKETVISEKICSYALEHAADEDSGAEENWNWGADEESSSQTNEKPRENVEELDELRVALRQARNEVVHLQKVEEKLKENIERQDKRLEAAEEYGLEMETKIEELEKSLEECNLEIEHLKKKTPAEGKIDKKKCEPHSEQLKLEENVAKLSKENEALSEELRLMKKRYEELSVKFAATEERYVEARSLCDELQERSKAEEKRERCTWGWDDEELAVPSDTEEVPANDSLKIHKEAESSVKTAGTEVQELKATISKLNEELQCVMKSREQLENELCLSNDRFKTIESDYQELKQHLSTCKEDVDNVQLPNIQPTFADEIPEAGNEDKAEGTTKGKAAFPDNGLHLNEESYCALIESERSLRRLLEGLETKLHDTEEYSVSLSEENATLESTVASLKEEISVLKATAEETNKSHDLLKQQKDEAENKLSVCANYEGKAGELEYQLKAAEAKIKEFSTIAELMREKKEEAEAELQAILIDKEKSSEGRSCSVQTDFDSELEKMKVQLVESRQSNEELKKNLHAMVKQNELLKDCECRLTEVVNAYEARILTNATEIKTLQTSVEELNSKFDEERKMKKKLEKTNTELEARLAYAEAQVTEEQNQVEALKKENTKITADRARLDEQKSKTNKRAVASTTPSWSLSHDVEPSGSMPNGADGNEKAEGSADEKRQLLSKISDLEVKCEKFSQEKKKMLRKLRYFQAELDSAKQDRSSSMGHNDSLASSLSPLMDSGPHEPEPSPSSSLFAMRRLSNSSRASPKPRLNLSEENDSVLDTSSSRRSSTAPLDELIQQLQTAGDDSVRRRKAGLRPNVK